MIEFDIIASKRKGEALLSLRNEEFESVKVVFHASSLNQIAKTMHFALKPGHLFVYAKRWSERSGHWVLRDAGYLNYFRADKPVVRLTQYNTLDKQKLFSKGWLGVQSRSDGVDLTSWSVLPIHRRRVSFRYGDQDVSIVVLDRYIGYRRVNWNFEHGLVQNRTWFRQRRVIEL